MAKILQQSIFVLFFIFIISISPLLITWNENTITFHLNNILVGFESLKNMVTNLNLGTYTLGATEREILPDLFHFASHTFIILLSSVVIGIFFSLIFAVFLNRFFGTRFLSVALHTLTIVPDFILILFSITFAVQIYQWTGIRVISLRPDTDPINLWFPIVVLSIAPTLYLFKLLTVRYRQISEEDYILTAVAKGLSVPYINFQHMYKNIEPFLKADLTKVISMTVGNLFIVEFLLNVPGLTKFLFAVNYQFQLTFIILLLLFLMSIIVYMIINFLLFLLKKGIIYE